MSITQKSSSHSILFVILFLMILVFGIAFLSWKHSWKTYTDQNGISVMYPKTWQSSNLEGLKIGSNQREALFALNGSLFRVKNQNIDILVFKFPKNAPGFGSLSKIEDDFALTEKDPKYTNGMIVADTKIDNIPTKVFQFISTSIDDGSRSVKRVYFVDAKENVYQVYETVTLDTPQWEVNLSLSLANQVVQTFKFNK